MAVVNDTTLHLEEAIYAQQKLLQKLYVDLEVEREASATAASEALSMILRLQGEKATIKMEANHYKIMAEEKIGHVEEYLTMYEDLLYQKQLEIASLEYQVEAYRCKILSMSCCREFGNDENDFAEKLLIDTGVRSKLITRLKSLPSFHFNDSTPKIVEQIDEIEDEQFKETSTGCKIYTPPQDPIKDMLTRLDDEDKFFEPFARSSMVDVFEVPQQSADGIVARNLFMEFGEKRLQKPDIVSQATLESVVQEAKKMPCNGNQQKQLCKSRDEMIVNCNVPIVQPTIDAAESRDLVLLLHKKVEDNSKSLEGIHGQLSSIVMEMRSLKSVKSPPPQVSSVDSLQEAMLYFWF